MGAALGAGLSIVLLHPGFIGAEWGWRIAFFMGGILRIAILLVRRHLPGSPRWLLMHGRADEAEAIVRAIESEIGVTQKTDKTLGMRALRAIPWADVAHVLAVRYPRRSVLGVVLMASQAFFYNAIFFTYALMLTRFYGIPEERVIGSTYAISGVLLILTAYALKQGILGPITQTLCWSVIFFFASAAASAAYLTVSEVFPLEMRAVTISLFYAFGTALGGFAGPPLYGAMIEGGSREGLFAAYALAGGLMCIAGLVAWRIGVDAERRPLEEVCPPLGTHDGPLRRGR